MDPRLGKMVCFGSEDPRLFNRRFIYMVRVASVKMPRLLAFARHVETDIIKVQKPTSATLNGKPDTASYNRYSGEFGEKPALQCQRQSAHRTHRH